MSQKIFSSILSEAENPLEAIREIAQKVKTAFGNHSCDLLALFISEPYQDLNPGEFLQQVKELLSPKCVIGCNASGVISNQNEIEAKPAISLLAMHLPDVQISPFSFSPTHVEMVNSGEDLTRYLGVDVPSRPRFLCFADPMTCDIRKMLGLFNEAYHGLPVIGGLASANMVNVDNWLILDDQVYSAGAVGVALTGDIEFDTLVSQGCRPIGEPLIITKATQNILYELASKPVLDVLGEVLEKLSPEDQSLAEHSLFVGIAMDEGRHNLGRGDFLIRNILGADQSAGALAIGEILEPGQTIQFQLRDATTSKEDLKILLEKLRNREISGHEGAVLVSCCGRGRGLYGEPSYDARLIQKIRGPIPLTGFFANGEFGIINQVNYVHGYTASLTILR